eukprot:767874-Hanusia_phi.AAC.3
MKTWEDLFDIHSEGEIDDEGMKELEDSLVPSRAALHWSEKRDDRVLCVTSPDSSGFARDWLKACKVLWRSRGCHVEERSVEEMKHEGRWTMSLCQYDLLLMDDELLAKELQRENIHVQILTPACDIAVEIAK